MNPASTLAKWAELEPCAITSTMFTNCLHPGARFVGTQISKEQKYSVKIVLQTTKPDEKLISGFLSIEKQNIDGSTESKNVTTTFFEGEVISRLFPFITGKWNASVEDDTIHWNELNVMSRFPGCCKENFDYSSLEVVDHVYMRWKEKFIVSDGQSSKSRDDHVSFSGFYYICLQKSTGVVTGYYYNPPSKVFQLLELKYVPQTAHSAFQMY